MTKLYLLLVLACICALIGDACAVSVIVGVNIPFIPHWLGVACFGMQFPLWQLALNAAREHL